MGIIFAIIGTLVLLWLIGLALMAVGIWLVIMASFLAFMIGGFSVSSAFQLGQDGFYLGGAGAVFLLWVLLAYIANRKDMQDASK